MGTLSGGGQINANGGNGTGNDGGGGGRVAIYTWTAMVLPVTNILASGGQGPSANGQNGSVYITTQPYLTFSDVPQIWHGTEQIAWLSIGIDPNAGGAYVVVSKGGSTYFQQSAPASGAINWNTATVADGSYTLTISLLDASGIALGQISQSELINNSAAWHEGALSTNQTWGTNTVNIVDQDIIIPSGVTLTIAPGAIVKFAPGTGIIIQAGGTLDASGATAGAPIIFTSLSDNSVGGDSDEDANSVPLPGDWNGITDSGQFNTSAYVQIRYVIQTQSGTISQSQEWSGAQEHLITGNVTIPSGVTLTIDPGAIIKFDLGLNLTVESGGTLIANGTVAQPIVFTSINDESVGTETNEVSTTPAAGDWDSIYLNGGQATFDHVSISYGGGPDSVNSGLISIIGAGSAAAVSDSILSQGFYRGIQAEYGTVNATNCVVSGCDRGIQSGLNGPTVVNIINCTVDDNNYGLFAHGGVMNVANTIVSDSLTAGIAYCCGSSLTTFEYCDVWSATGTYSAPNWPFPDQTGANGNISANPNFVNAAQGNYELNYGSPCINSADGAVAPLTDLTGAPCYNDPRTPVKTGVTNANGVYPDMGAFEFVETALSDVDMIVTSVTGPLQETAGQTVTVQWNDVNIGTGNAIGPWHDTVSLVPQNGSGTLVAATVLVAQDVVLGPGQSYATSASVVVPGGTEGDYQWQVQVNSQGDIFEGVNWTNDTTLAAASTTLNVPALPIGGSLLTNQFTSVGQYQWYTFVAQSNATVLLSLNLAGAGGSVELFVGQGYMPTPQSYDFTQWQWNSGPLTLAVPVIAGQTYYVLVYAESLPTGSSAFTIGGQLPDFGISSITPTAVGNVGCVTFAVSGDQFQTNDIVEIISPSGAIIQAVTNTWMNSALIQASFDMTGAVTGVWGLQVSQGGLGAGMTNAFTVSSGGGTQAWVTIDGAEDIRAGRPATYTINYGNSGNVDGDICVALQGIPNDVQVQLGPGFVSYPISIDGTQFVQPPSLASPQGLILMPLGSAALAPGQSAEASFTLTVPSTEGDFSIQPWTFVANTTTDEYVTNVYPNTNSAQITTKQIVPLAAGGCGCNSLREEVGLNILLATAQEYAPRNNFNSYPCTTANWASRACVGIAIDEICQLSQATENNPNLCGFSASRITHSSGSHTTVLVQTPCNNYYVIDTYIGTPQLINATPVAGGGFMVNAVGSFLADANGSGGSYWDPYDADEGWFSLGTDTNNPSNPPPCVGCNSCGKSACTDMSAMPCGGGWLGQGYGSGLDCNPPKPPKPPPTPPSPQPPMPIHPKKSSDPNVKLGPAGFGSNHYIAPNEPLSYQINFQNETNATAPAQEVVVTDSLSTNLDWSTFELWQIGFNNVTIDVPPGLQTFTTNVSVSTDPNPVQVTANLDPNTGTVTWTMESINPATGQLVTDPLAGFLPPDNTNGDGEGFVSFVVSPNTGLATGARILNQASIIFDVNAPILTDIVTNTVDATPPTSSITALPSTSPPVFPVSWSGYDAGSGIADFDIYVSTNGGPWTSWLLDTTNTSALFSGAYPNTYAFYSVAYDEVGLVETNPVIPGASTAALIQAPGALTLAASGITPSNATLNSSVTPNGAPTAVWFQWGATASYGNLTAANTLSANLNTAQPVSALISNLLPGTTSHFQVAASNSAGTSYGVDLTIVTPPIGSLQVTLTPSGAVAAGAQWRVDGGTDQNSGTTVTNLSAGSHIVSFTPISEWNTPPSQTVTIIGGMTTTAGSIYTPSTTPPDGLILLTNGFGTIQHAAWPTPAIGKKYKVTAVPKAKNVFVNWVGGTNQPYSILTNSAGYTFAMQSNLVLEANFVTNVFLAAQGTYRGLFAPTNTARQQTNSGAFLFSVTSSGAVSGNLDLGGHTVPLSGKFDLDGTATNIVSKKDPSLTTTLQLDFADQSVSGTVSNDTFTAELNGFRDEFSSSDKATEFEGQYTLVIPGTNDPTVGPFGTSYGMVKVDDLGNITLAGSLADGTAISQSSVVSQDGYWPLYVSLYGGKGSLWGWNYFTNHTLASAPALSWINATNSARAAVYRSGFTNQQAVLTGELYDSTFTWPADLTVILEEGDLPFAITNGVAIGSGDNIVLTNSLDETNKLILTIHQSTGVISGSFANPASPKQAIKVNGVILEGQTNAQGYFLGTNQSGVFILGSP